MAAAVGRTHDALATTKRAAPQIPIVNASVVPRPNTVSGFGQRMHDFTPRRGHTRTGEHPMKYLTILECPVAYPAENRHSLSSKDMMPRFGVTAGLESQHLRVLDSRITSVCIWQSEFQAKRYFDRDWTARAEEIWGDRYQMRFEPVDSASAA